jgi:hypothetical protein
MTPVGRKNAYSDSGDNGSTSSVADEQDISRLPEGVAGFDTVSHDFSTSLNVYRAQASNSDPLSGSAASSDQLPSISAFGDSSGLQLAMSSASPESAVAVTSGGITFNLLFDAAAPASFRATIQQAAAMLTSVISDQITVNLNIHYSGTGGGASAKPDNGLFESYSSTIAALVNHASLGDTTLSMLPGGSSIQGQSQVAVWNAQLKALGFLGATAGTDDGEATFARDILSSQ